MKADYVKILLLFICLNCFCKQSDLEIFSANPVFFFSCLDTRHALPALAPKSVFQDPGALTSDLLNATPPRRKFLGMGCSAVITAVGSQALGGCASALEKIGLSYTDTQADTQLKRIKAVTSHSMHLGDYKQEGGVNAAIYSSISKDGRRDFTSENYDRLCALLRFIKINSSFLTSTRKIYLLNESEFRKTLPENVKDGYGLYSHLTPGAIYLKISDMFITNPLYNNNATDYFTIILTAIHEATHCYEDTLPRYSIPSLPENMAGYPEIYGQLGRLNPGPYGSLTIAISENGKYSWKQSVSISQKNAYAYGSPSSSALPFEDSSYTVQFVYNIIYMLTSFENEASNPNLRDSKTRGIERYVNLVNLEEAFLQLNGEGGDVLVRKIESLKDRFPPSGYARFLKALEAFKAMPRPEKMPDDWIYYVYSCQMEKILERFIQGNASFQSVSEWTSEVTFKDSAEESKTMTAMNNPAWLFNALISLSHTGPFEHDGNNIIELILLGPKGRKPINDKLNVLASAGLIPHGDTLEKAVNKMEKFFMEYAFFNPLLAADLTKKFGKDSRDYYEGLITSVIEFFETQKKKPSEKEMEVPAPDLKNVITSFSKVRILKKYGFLKEHQTDPAQKNVLGSLGTLIPGLGIGGITLQNLAA
jgi:hypothetical protein